MKDVLFELEGDPELFKDDGIQRKLTYEGYYITGRRENTVVIVTHYHEDDDGNELTETIPIDIMAYEALKGAFEKGAYAEPGYGTSFRILRPIGIL